VLSPLRQEAREGLARVGAGAPIRRSAIPARPGKGAIQQGGQTIASRKDLSRGPRTAR
jgi:hypothetical protein